MQLDTGAKFFLQLVLQGFNLGIRNRGSSSLRALPGHFSHQRLCLADVQILNQDSLECG